MFNQIVLTALAAFASVLPLGAEAHLRILGTALGVSGVTDARVAVGQLVAAFLMGVMARRAVAHARGRARRKESVALGIGLLFGIVGAEVLRRVTLDVRPSALAIGAGLVLTSVMLATVAVAPHPSSRRSRVRAALVVATALGLSGLPGGSAVASACVALAWSGRRVDVGPVFALAAPLELARAIGTLARAPIGTLARAPLGSVTVDMYAAAASVVAALLVAALAARMFVRAMPRVVSLAPRWLALLGVAELAMAWALSGR